MCTYERVHSLRANYFGGDLAVVGKRTPCCVAMAALLQFSVSTQNCVQSTNLIANNFFVNVALRCCAQRYECIVFQRELQPQRLLFVLMTAFELVPLEDVLQIYYCLESNDIRAFTVIRPSKCSYSTGMIGVHRF